MIKNIVRKLRGDYTVWKQLNSRIDQLEKELNEIRINIDHTVQLLDQLEKHHAGVNLVLLKVLDELQKLDGLNIRKEV